MPSAPVVAWHCEDDAETITGWLDVCKVRWRPGEIGVSRDELHKSPEFCSHLHVRRRPPLFLDSNSRKLVAVPVSIHTLPG